MYNNIIETAKYKEQPIKSYKGNPFIEALPPILHEDDFANLFNEYPEYDENERNLPIEERLHCLDLIYECFQELSFHEEIEFKISKIIREGYIHRNPITPSFTKALNIGFDSIQNEDINMYNANSIRRNTAFGLSIVGGSGMGKTSIVNKILSYYPQVIQHSEYNGIDLNTSQLVYLKLDCPFDGSIKGLCLDFFFNVDKVLGTNYYQKYGGNRGRSVNAMMPIIAQIAQNHGLGVLVIDEIQHLSVAKSGGIQKMLNFFVTLINMIGIPVILIGTPKALPILKSEFRQARRSSGQGDCVIERLKYDSDWEYLLKALFKYQWTNKRFKLTEELSDALYEGSMGIIDIAVKLYVMSQSEAIKNEDDVITAEIINFVLNNNFKLIKPSIDKLKSIDIETIQSGDGIPDDLLVGPADELVKSNLERNKKKIKQKKKDNNKKAVDIENLNDDDLRKIVNKDESNYKSLEQLGYINSDV